MAKARLSTQSSPQGQTLNATALLVETFATIRRLLHEGNIGELNNRLQLLNLESTALRKQGQELLDSFANSTEEAANIENQRGEAKDQLDLGKTKLANALDSLKEHQSPVERNIKEITNTQEKLSECEQRLEQINTFDNPSVAMAKLEVSARGMNAGLTVASAATTGGLNVYAASMGEKMKEMLAGMMLNNAAIEAITELLNQLIQAMSKNYEQFDEMFVSMLNGLQKSSQSKVDMMNTARFA